jgi:hypothetical protein
VAGSVRRFSLILLNHFGSPQIFLRIPHVRQRARRPRPQLEIPDAALACRSVNFTAAYV